MIKTDKYYELIIKEFEDEISWEEQEFLDRENSINPVYSQKYLIVKEFWQHFFPQNKPHNIISKTEKKLGFTYRTRAKIKLSFAIKVAASLLFIMSLGFSAYHLIMPNQQIALKEFINNTDKVKEITLSDGTKVWLNSMSILLTVEPFVNTTREVKLIGEAYFEVAENPEQPFVVKSDELRVKVLGTHFNISAYPGDLKHEVSLYEGKVQLLTNKKTEEELFLTSGQKASYKFDTGKIYISKENGKPAEWRDGILRFYDEDFNSICKKLERKFHTKILIADPQVGDLHFTANFDIEPLDKILTLLQKAQNFNYINTKNGVIIESSKNKTTIL